MLFEATRGWDRRQVVEVPFCPGLLEVREVPVFGIIRARPCVLATLVGLRLLEDVEFRACGIERARVSVRGAPVGPRKFEDLELAVFRSYDAHRFVLPGATL